MRIKNYFGKQLFVLLVIFMAFGTGEVFAGHDEDAATAAKSEHHGKHHSMSMPQRPLQNAVLKGLKVSLDVMDMGMHLHMQAMEGNTVPDSYNAGQSHAIMLMIQSTASKETVKDADVSVTVTSPSGKKIIGRAPWLGDHYGRPFNPTENGAYKIVFKIEAKEGQGEVTFKYVYGT